ncbi:vWA domain-containing protein [Leucobacter sp. NPDC015123]|uniref:vWA domain-containing protein n=1 Tax=Leucobacter sp. NPDC015123 TaxID=3364129 RepID=UPI0036F4AD69
MSEEGWVERSQTGETSLFDGELAATGRLLGLRVTVVAGEEWRVDGGQLAVGREYFTRRGHDVGAAVALTVRELWFVSGVGRSMGREHRRSRVLVARPDLHVLMVTLDRVQAQRALLDVVPGFGKELFRAVRRDIPQTLVGWPPSAQWLGLLQRASLGLPAHVHEVVGRQFTAVVRAALEGAAAVDPVEGLDQLLAVAVPVHEALAAGNGLGDAADGAAGNRQGERVEGEGIGDLGSPGAAEIGADGAMDQEEERGTGNEGGPESEVPPLVPPDPLLSVTAIQDPLVEIDSGDTPLVLSETPLSSLRPSLAPPHGDLGTQTEDGGVAVRGFPEPGPTNGWRHGRAAALAEYRHRLATHRDEVRAVGDVWRRLLRESLRVVRPETGAAGPEPGSIHTGRLAETVAESRGGVPRPSAYRIRKPLTVRGPGLGQTDTVLVLDRSGSMRGQAAQLSTDAAMVFLEALAGAARELRELEARFPSRAPSIVRSGLVVFDSVATLVKRCGEQLTDLHRVSLREALATAEGQTHPVPAIELAMRELLTVQRTGGATQRRVLVFVSDGGFEASQEDAEGRALAGVLARARSAGIEVCGVGIGATGGMELFRPDLTSIGSVRELPAALAQLLSEHRRWGA